MVLKFFRLRNPQALHIQFTYHRKTFEELLGKAHLIIHVLFENNG